MAGVPFNPLSPPVVRSWKTAVGPTKPSSIYEALLQSSARQAGSDFNSSAFSQSMSKDVSEAANSIYAALTAPVDAYEGRLNRYEIDPSTGALMNVGLMDAATNMAGLVQLGSMPLPRPSGSLGMGGRKWLPSSDSLSSPSIPSPEILQRLGRVESVDLSKARSTNSPQWDRFNAGDHPPELVSGFADRPIAVRKENGEYLIIDGNHRTSLAASNGAKEVEMYVIDAKDYDPANAGRAVSSSKSDISDDELLRALGF